MTVWSASFIFDKMLKFNNISILVLLILLVSCQTDSVNADALPDVTTETSAYISGKAVVKVSQSLAEKLESETENDVLLCGTTFRRTFAHGGQYEERMRREGLHLWYSVEFDESAPLTKAGNDLMRIDGVELVEYLPVTVLQDEPAPFDDPYLKRQWHYINAGNPITGLLEGCDINVAPAWERGVVGKDNVIVAVIDTGVDVNHEDLKDNIWQGTDANGNIINGYNAFLENNKINPEDHGTHVAGTIAAVNNNGIGVSGIAGGDAAAGIGGVRIMSCAIFDGDNNGNQAEALIWAANHGAVIAQNSWGFRPEANLTDTPLYMKEAIDYFNTYAGCDKDGNQLPDSPMKGGVVIFASGNDALAEGYPASYEGCIAVSAVSGDYKSAYYSNVGDWVDIAAPGGDAQKNQMVLSTVPDNNYDRMQGTSMACPHVSGVAALVLSEFGGPGFTREDLIDRLLKTARDISLPSRYMGHGLVDASAATAHYGEYKPFVPEFDNYEDLSGTSLTMQYILPPANQGVVCRGVDLYFSEEPFDVVSETLKKVSVPIKKYVEGETLTITIDGLEFNTTYYFSVQGYDALGYLSELSENRSVTTRDNLPPVIEALDETDLSLKKYMWKKLRFAITDPEGGLKDVVYENATDADVFSHNDGMYYLVIDAKNIPAGTYKSRIIATDDSEKVTECVISFTVEENNAPTVSSPLENILIKSKSASKKLTLSDYFSDPDGETLTYSVSSSDNSVVKASVMRDELTLNAVSYGESVMTVTATDGLSATVQATFKVVIRDGSKEFDVFPNPVKDGKMYVRGSDSSEAEVKIISSSGAVVYEGKVVPDPFSPAVQDISSLLPGIYNVKVTGVSGKTYTQNIVKL